MQIFFFIEKIFNNVRHNDNSCDLNIFFLFKRFTWWFPPIYCKFLKLKTGRIFLLFYIQIYVYKKHICIFACLCIKLFQHQQHIVPAQTKTKEIELTDRKKKKSLENNDDHAPCAQLTECPNGFGACLLLPAIFFSFYINSNKTSWSNNKQRM